MLHKCTHHQIPGYDGHRTQHDVRLGSQAVDRGQHAARDTVCYVARRNS
jgi:hypothetical protein